MSGTSIFDDQVVGTAYATAVGSGQSSALNINQLSSLANQQFNQAYGQTMNWHAQQQLQYNQALMARMAQQQHRWMINGVTMNFDEFLDTICPEPEDPMRSFLTLKYKGME